MKPFCTGDRGDVELLQKLQPGKLLDTQVNPYFFPEPLAPCVAAKHAGQIIKLDDVMRRISEVQSKCDLLLIEGFKRETHDKLEVFRRDLGKPLISPGDASFIAILSDGAVPETGLPVIDLNDVTKIADFIVEHCRLQR